MKILIIFLILLAVAPVYSSIESIFKEYNASKYVSWDKKTAFISEVLPAPFWHSKPKLNKKLRENRLVPVSVKTEEPKLEGDFKKLVMVSGTIVNVPMLEVFNFALDYENYGKVSTYVKRFKVYQEKKLIYSFTSAFNYSQEFLMQTYVAPIVATSNKRQLQWRVVGGTFRGMRVSIEFVDIGSRKTEIIMRAFYKYKTMPLPELFLEFGLEVVLQKASERLRTMVEEHYNKTIAKPTTNPKEASL